VVVCQNADEAVRALEGQEPAAVFDSVEERRECGVAFLFPGQGAQYVDMGKELYESEPTFRKYTDQCAGLLLPHLGLDLREVLYPEAAQSESAAWQLEQTWLTQPALFAVEYALAQVWLEWGVQPQAMIGHSLGEYVAACLAGVFSLEDALTLVAARGRLMQAQPGGAMLAVGLSEAAAREWLGERERAGAECDQRDGGGRRGVGGATGDRRGETPAAAHLARLPFRTDGGDAGAVCGAGARGAVEPTSVALPIDRDGDVGDTGRGDRRSLLGAAGARAGALRGGVE
jgi:hypothetical protein